VEPTTQPSLQASDSIRYASHTFTVADPAEYAHLPNGEQRTALIAAVQVFQRFGRYASDIWTPFADRMAGGRRDPKYHTVEALTAFLTTMRAAPNAPPNYSITQLVEDMAQAARAAEGLGTRGFSPATRDCGPPSPPCRTVIPDGGLFPGPPKAGVLSPRLPPALLSGQPMLPRGTHLLLARPPLHRSPCLIQSPRTFVQAPRPPPGRQPP
jgi:hypothetical protein